MILNGNQRGGAKDLALHLMKDENEHVELHELRGFASDNLMSALNEAYAISRGTRCTQFLYSLSLNPPPGEAVDIDAFEAAIEQAEERLGLTGQPRAIVFHEKEGPGGVRRHAHVVWSRIDAAEMKAVQMSFDREKLTKLSRELFLEHGWRMPEGLTKSENRDPRNFTLEDWQQAKRAGKYPRAIKAAIQDAWAISDTKAAFSYALHERGYLLARGDRRGFVAVDLRGKVYAIPRMAGVKTKAVRERLGDEAELPSVDQTKAQIAELMEAKLKGLQQDQQLRDAFRCAEYAGRVGELVRSQREKRQQLAETQQKRAIIEARQRQARFRTGLRGVWDWLRGENRRIRRINEEEAAIAAGRDRAEKERLIQRQLSERRTLRERAKLLEHRGAALKHELQQDIDYYKDMRAAARDLRHAELRELRGSAEHHRTRRPRGPTRER
ncbi:MAG: relaxase/mobilization nuclease domain-containing protein [Neomegalonema sp.]|nr:relaxase/mobilization nuclease domain-containing protein [Neomegalonema sp.]